MTPEATIKAKMRDYLRSIGAYWFAPVQMGMGVATLDILCCIKGKFVGIEVKVPGKKPTARQMFTICAISNAGGLAIWCTSLDELKTELAQAGLI